MSSPEERKSITVKFPQDEAKAIAAEASKLSISVTMLFRLWVRETIMKDPIKLFERD